MCCGSGHAAKTAVLSARCIAQRKMFGAIVQLPWLAGAIIVSALFARRAW